MPPEETIEKPQVSHAPHKVWHILGIVVLCFVASFLGAWLFIGTGLVRLDASRTISDNSEKIVLQQGEVIADVFKKVSPSTVAITTKSIGAATQNGFFTNAGEVLEGAGSGIIVSKDGYIMTNKHVLPDGINSVSVVTSDGHEYKNVKVLGRDPTNDVAFLKIEGVSDLVPATIGDSDQVEPGQQVVAIGNALGIFRNSVTSGIVSGTGRPLTASDESGAFAEQLEDMFQTDAAINPGNSGGPLVNLKGEVVGMNTAVTQDAQGIGFAIPINTVKVALDSVVTKGKLIKAYIGVRYVSITPELAAELKLPVTDGALIANGTGREPAVIAGGPADKAGMKAGDIVVKVNGQKVVAGKGLASLLSPLAPGASVELTVLRDNKEQTIKVTLGEYPL